ncbi:MAG: hypothetical protein ACOX6U_00730 [Oscillospiraceae bacterium]|jgi:hypothetical protein
MKQITKNVIVIICICFFMLGLAACDGKSAADASNSSSEAQNRSQYMPEEDVAKEYDSDGIPKISVYVDLHMLQDELQQKGLPQAENIQIAGPISEKYIYYTARSENSSQTEEERKTQFVSICRDEGAARFWKGTRLTISFEFGAPDTIEMESVLLSDGTVVENQDALVVEIWPKQQPEICALNKDGAFEYTITTVSSAMRPLNPGLGIRSQLNGIRLICTWDNVTYEYCIPFRVFYTNS